MSDTPEITPKRLALLQGLARQAAAWWREKIQGPGYLSKFDNGDTSRDGEFGRMLASLAALKTPPPSADKFAHFEQLLTEAVLSRLLRQPVPPTRNLAHLAGERPGFTEAEMEEIRARAAASPAEHVVLSVDYSPEGLLRETAAAAGVAGFPWKTTMWVCWDARPDCCYVEVRAGYGHPIVRLPAAGEPPRASQS